MPTSRTSRRLIAVAALLTLALPAAPAAGARDREPAKAALAQRLLHSAPRPAVRPDPDVQRLARAVADRRYAVLVLHAASTADVRAVAAAAHRAGFAVRHVLPGIHAVSVRVPRADLMRTARRALRLPGVRRVEQAGYRIPSAGPDDPDYPLQRGYLGAVHAPNAWERQQGSSSIRIAVVDTGVDVAHPDLAGKIAGSYNATDGTADVTDDNGHGTFVAGVAAAATNNGIGVAGAGYASDILAVKVTDDDSVVTADDEAAGIIWAADHGAKIINVSLAGAAPSDVERSAVEYAQGAGALVIGAAGNNASTDPSYPAAYSDVVAVAATDAVGGRASFSDYGPWITLAAPGVGIHSTTPIAGSTMFGDGTGGYGDASGTSFAAPIVAGEAALVLAQDPALSATALRATLVDSAAGYEGLGLGTGQADFVGALDEVPPTTQPTSLAPDGTAGVITFHAASSAARVSFAVNTQPFSTPVAVVAGVARFAFASWGLPNGISTIRAVDCTKSNACSTSATEASFLIDNRAAVITAPRSGAAVTGGFTITATSSGGGVRFLIDGSPRGFDGAAPYSFRYSGSALAEGRHTLQVRQCSADQAHCLGPLSSITTITSNSLHPSILGVTPVVFSPNGDGVKDTSVVTYSLPAPQHVAITVYNARNVRVRGPLDYGTLTGRRTWAWNGHGPANAHLPDGAYRIQIDTSRIVNGATVRGSVSRSVRVDTIAPTMTATYGNGVTFYPYPDGYHDAFTPTTTLGEDGGMTMQIKAASGAVVQTIVVYHRHAGRNGITWYGRNRSGVRVGAGTYSWTFTAQDAQGNVRHSAIFHVYVSARHLVTKTAVVRKNGDAYFAAGGSDACADADPGSSFYLHGVELLNTCGAYGEYSQIAAAIYRFQLPAAAVYERLYVRVSGNVFYAPSEVSAAFFRADSDIVDIPHFTVLRDQGDYEFPLSSALGGPHVSATHVATIGVAVDGEAADVSDFDLQWVQVTVAYRVLQ